MGFYPSKAEPDTWMRSNGYAYENIGIYVDDLVIIARNPQEIEDVLMTKYTSSSLRVRDLSSFTLAWTSFVTAMV
jgi:hypothetical protein